MTLSERLEAAVQALETTTKTLQHIAERLSPDQPAPLTPEELRFLLHLADHGCGSEGGPGFSYCDEAMRLFRALPAAKQVVQG